MSLILGSAFSWVDWSVLIGYFVLLIVSGILLSRRQKGTEDYFLAGRKMPPWAVAISVLASMLSAATFLGAPQIAYGGNLTYISSNIGVIVATVIVALFFIPAFYRRRVTTVYELLGQRYGHGAKLAGSWTFMIGRVFASGARIYIAANALAFVAFGDLEPMHLLFAVWVLTLAGVLYTIAGGIETVIWTDVVQTCVFLIAVLAAVVLLFMSIPASTGEIMTALSNGGADGESKLKVLDFSLDPSRAFTVWTALTGIMLLNLAALGTDHDLVQRMLTCSTPWKGSKSVVMSTILSIPTVLLFLVIGLLLWVFYNQPDLMGAAAPDASRVDGKRVFLHFITNEMPRGLSGLMIAGLFAVGLGSLDSALNAMSATFVNDFYKPRYSGRHERHYLLVGRLGVVMWGLLLGIFATICIYWERAVTRTFIDFALGVMVFAYSGLLGVFVAALFTPRGSTRSVIVALIAGFFMVAAMDPVVWKLGTELLQMLGILSEAAAAEAKASILLSWLYEEKLAWPWRMLIATTISFLIAICGNTPGVNEPRRAR